MTNIERLLEAVIRVGADGLAIDQQTPPHAIKDGKSLPLWKAVLTPVEWQFMEDELGRVFGQATSFDFQGQRFSTRLEGSRREFTRLPLPAPPSPPLSGDQVPTLAAMLPIMIERRASDLHLATGSCPSLRVDGDIVTMEGFLPLTEEVIWQELTQIAPERNIAEFRESQDTDFAYQWPGRCRFRVNVFRDHHGIGAVLRQIPSKILSTGDLAVPEAVVTLCGAPKGLILVTGPTGSGKSTTLASLIDHINRNRKLHIITIEDPVEFLHENRQSIINQREVLTHTESFKRALRAALREDPDVVLVGEMRDLETIAIAIETAATGHLVLGTLHTSSAVGTVDRVIDQFPSGQQAQIRSMLSDALICVISQTLCKRKGGGRAAAYEVLVVNVAISNLIREGKTFQIPTLMQTGKAQGNRLMVDALTELVEKGQVEAPEAIAKSIDKEVLRARLQARGLFTEEKPGGASSAG